MCHLNIEVIKDIEEGKKDNAIKKQQELIERLQSVEEKDKSGTMAKLREFSQKTVDKFESPFSSEQELKKEVHVSAYSFGAISLYQVDPDWDY